MYLSYGQFCEIESIILPFLCDFFLFYWNVVLFGDKFNAIIMKYFYFNEIDHSLICLMSTYFWFQFFKMVRTKV